MRALTFYFRVFLVPGMVALVTELASADAFHMGAANFSLDGLMAFGALPCIIANPSVIDLLSIEFFLPYLNL